MYIGRTYKITEFLFWTRRNLFLLLLISIVPVLLYELLGLQWLVVPWPIVAFLGTATAFVAVGRTGVEHAVLHAGRSGAQSLSAASRRSAGIGRGRGRGRSAAAAGTGQEAERRQRAAAGDDDRLVHDRRPGSGNDLQVARPPLVTTAPGQARRGDVSVNLALRIPA